MATLKGQNVRLLQYVSGNDYKVFAKATSCVVTLTGNTEDASNKDITGMAAMPTIVSKGWQMQLESLEVLDMNSILSAMANGNTIDVRFDEVSSTDNQTELKVSFQRKGSAFISDATFNFNDRETAVKNITLSGTGALTHESNPTVTTIIPSTTYTKGQFVRLFLGRYSSDTPDAVIASAKQLAFHVSLQMETSTTKDTVGNWIVQEAVGLSYDISTNALVGSGETVTSTVIGQTFEDMQVIYETGTPVKFQIANVSGANQRTKGTVIVSGSVVLTSLKLNAPNRQVATYDAQMQGYGDYTVGS